MSSSARALLRGSSRQAIAYLLAVLLPPLATWITLRVEALHPLPFALHFVILAAVAALGGIGPSLVGIVSIVFSRQFLLPSVHPSPASTSDQFLRLAVLLVAAAIVSFIGSKRLRSESSLQTVLSDLRDRTDALIESLSSSKCASWTLDLGSGRSARWYSGSYPVFGRPFAELEAMPSLRSLIYEEDQPRFPALVEHMTHSSEPCVFEFRSLWPNGELHWIEMRGTRVAGPGCRWRGVALDITERRLAEAAVLRSEKLAAMGRLASTVAHEINNPLEAVTNLLYLIRNEELPETARGYLATAERELARLGTITRLTLGFVRTNASSASVEVAAIVDDVLSIFQHRLDTRRVSVERHYEPGVFIEMPPHELRQIATNLVANATDAVPVGSARIAITICRTADTAVIIVQDNGPGIDAVHLPRIFEPFFSTKQEVGTGIGLWVTRELVEKNGGRIWVESSPGSEGYRTAFRIEFPLVPAFPPDSTALDRVS
jgi:signal transduction histidine kinase